ncbi:MAG: PAS domain-containing protein [Desulfarculaceae bacterium]|nr:PAS domain-containing protein [Desulfarculaceae bacterium]MCF8071462.1 PAS domain-containing protein [Desulfarculaceae bacterium]MCF8103410.1 PAS domain-containing protein [Desulfarculaceae bacterium]MCF8118183.1 PAS domain-containing protein [Desulfarculaceae bacterium]
MPKGTPEEQRPMRLAIIGGGERCLSVLNMLDSRRLKRLHVEVVGVADLNSEAVGIRLARDQGIFTTTECAELCTLKDLDLIIELTDDQELLDNLAQNNPDSAKVIGHTASRLFHDIVAIYQELEEREDEVSVARSFSQALIDGTSEGIMVLDPDYRITRANQAALGAAGISREEALGRYCFQVSHQAIAPCDSPDTPCPMKQTLATGMSAHAIHEHVQPDGTAHYCDVSTFPLVNRKGEVVQVLELFRDITDELSQRVERRTQAIKADLAALVQEDKLIALGKLVASVAHEINNPIASILNFTKLIHKGLGRDKVPAAEIKQYREYLALCSQEAERCSRIVGNLLSFARQKQLTPRVVDLGELLRTTITLIAHRMELGGVELSLELADEPLLTWGDSSQIQQVLTNLVFNAIEAMPEGGELNIRGNKSQGSQQVVLEFADTGEGIAPENLGHLFEPFFSTKSRGHGVGLGLSMVYGILREHQGNVEVESEPGQGALFRVSLPALEDNGQEEGGTR